MSRTVSFGVIFKLLKQLEITPSLFDDFLCNNEIIHFPFNIYQ